MPAILRAANVPAAGTTAGTALEAGRFGVSFSTSDGSLNITRDRRPLLVGCTPRVLLAQERRSTSQPAYEKTVSIRSVEDRLGKGRQLLATCRDGQQGLDLEIRVTIYPARDAVTVEAVCRNSSRQDVALTGLDPLYTPLDNPAAGLIWPGCSKVLTNGKMYYDAGRVARSSSGRIESWWNVCLYRGEREPGLVVGYLENNASLGRVYVEPGRSADDAHRLARLIRGSRSASFIAAHPARASPPTA